MYTIKKLKWKKDKLNKGLYWAQSFYVFSFEIWRKEHEALFTLYTDRENVKYSRLKDAKAAAQTHYEKEVKKHLLHVQRKSPDESTEA